MSRWKKKSHDKLDIETITVGLKLAEAYIGLGVLNFRDFVVAVKDMGSDFWHFAKRYLHIFWVAEMANSEFKTLEIEDLTAKQALAIIKEVDGMTQEEFLAGTKNRDSTNDDESEVNEESGANSSRSESKESSELMAWISVCDFPMLHDLRTPVTRGDVESGMEWLIEQTFQQMVDEGERSEALEILAELDVQDGRNSSPAQIAMAAMQSDSVHAAINAISESLPMMKSADDEDVEIIKNQASYSELPVTLADLVSIIKSLN